MKKKKLKEINKKIKKLEKELYSLYKIRDKISKGENYQKRLKLIGTCWVYKNNCYFKDGVKWDEYYKVIDVKGEDLIVEHVSLKENKYPIIEITIRFDMSSYEKISEKKYDEIKTKVLNKLGILKL